MDSKQIRLLSIVNKDGGWHVLSRNPDGLKELREAVEGLRESKIHLTPEA
ncbi:MAG: hypothetical protein ACFCU3_11285 [Verrucomicrobiales bacterium]